MIPEFVWILTGSAFLSAAGQTASVPSQHLPGPVERERQKV